MRPTDHPLRPVVTVAVYGARGFVGSAICAGLRSLGVEPIEVVRGQVLTQKVDVLVNAACPSQRLRAERQPWWDYHECVTKTAMLYYRRSFDRFLQVSSVSARYPATVYGRHRLMAEHIVANGLVVRLGPMYGEGLVKGVLTDMLADRTVYADPDTRYAYAGVGWVGRRIAELALSPRTGTVEVGGSGSLSLREIADAIGSRSDFQASEFLPGREDQVFPDGGPDSRLVLDWLSR